MSLTTRLSQTGQWWAEAGVMSAIWVGMVFLVWIGFSHTRQAGWQTTLATARVFHCAMTDRPGIMVRLRPTGHSETVAHPLFWCKYFYNKNISGHWWMIHTHYSLILCASVQGFPCCEHSSAQLPCPGTALHHMGSRLDQSPVWWLQCVKRKYSRLARIARAS
jgi:hypothetical protein